MGNGTRESKFWGRIVDALWRSNRVLNRIENGVVDGMPDSYYTIAGVSGWMELKCPIEPARNTTALFSGGHPLSLAQRNWLIQHHQAGGLSWVAIETDRHMFLVGGEHADFINKQTVDGMQDLAEFWSIRPMNESTWREFALCLTRSESQ